MPVFLYTDIESSTQLREQHGQAMDAILGRHDHFLLHCLDALGGRQVNGAYEPARRTLHEHGTFSECAYQSSRTWPWSKAQTLAGGLAAEEKG